MGFTKAKAKAKKDNQNASKQRSEGEGLQEALPLRDERGASTSAAAPMHHPRKTTPDRKKRGRGSLPRMNGEAGPSVRPFSRRFPCSFSHCHFRVVNQNATDAEGRDEFHDAQEEFDVEEIRRYPNRQRKKVQVPDDFTDSGKLNFRAGRKIPIGESKLSTVVVSLCSESQNCFQM